MPRVGEVRPGVPNPDPAAAVSKSDKVAYVKRQAQTRDHHCHWPGCTKQVPPAMWGCYRHWMRLPKRLRDAVWAAYRPGQETNWTPSREYLRVAHEVQLWIRDNFPQEADGYATQ